MGGGLQWRGCGLWRVRGWRATAERVWTVEVTQGRRRVSGWRATAERVLTVKVTQGMWRMSGWRATMERVSGWRLQWRGCRLFLRVSGG